MSSMRKPERERITIKQRDSEQDATFIATKYDVSTSITVDGPVPMRIDQISIRPADYSGDSNSDCGVSLDYRRTSQYHTHLGSHIVLKPEQEVRLVEWLHKNDVDFIIETKEFESESLQDAKFRGRCQECGEHFDRDTNWKVTIHNEDGYDKHFCTNECFQGYSSC